MMTALALALRAAGLRTAPEQLRDVAIDVLAKSGGVNQAADEALFCSVSHNAALLCELFKPYRAAATRRFLNEVSALLRSEAEKAGGGQKQHETLASSAPAGAPDARATWQDGGGRRRYAHQADLAPSARQNAQPNGGVGEAGPKQAREPITTRPVSPPITEGMKARSQAAADSLLLTFKPDGDRPIGEWTGGECLSWGRTHGVHARFVVMLGTNIPIQGRVSDFHTDDQAREYWRRAQELRNVA